MTPTQLIYRLRDNYDKGGAYTKELTTLAFNIKYLTQFTIGLREERRIAVTIGSDAREYRIGKFLRKFAALFVDACYYVGEESRYESWAEFEARMRQDLAPDEYKLKLQSHSDVITWVAENWYKIATNSGIRSEILSGDDIWDPYEEIYSCMSGCEALDLYTKNPNRVQMLHMTDEDGETIGRALIWRTDDGATLLDRVYPSDNGPQTIYARQYARDNGWAYRVNDHADDNKVSDGVNHTVTLDNVDAYPYMDTLFYGKENGDGTITFSIVETAGSVRFDTTDNENPFGLRSCDDCGDYHPEDDLHFVDEGDHEVCSYCLDSFYHYVEYHGYIHMDRVVWDEINREYILEEDAAYIDCGRHAGEYTLEANTCTDEDGNTILKSTSIELWNGNHASEEDTVLITYGPYEGYYERSDYAQNYTDEDGNEHVVERSFAPTLQAV